MRILNVKKCKSNTVNLYLKLDESLEFGKCDIKDGKIISKYIITNKLKKLYINGNYTIYTLENHIIFEGNNKYKIEV